MNDRTLTEAARATIESMKRDWAESTFRGIDQLATWTKNIGDGHTARALIGSWHGAWIEIAEPGVARLCERCDTCSMFVAKTGLPSCDSPYMLSQAILASPATNTAACFDCRWLDDAATVAAQAPLTRRAQRRFERRYGSTCDDVLARRNAQRRHN